jgi:hypothetical protein
MRSGARCEGALLGTVLGGHCYFHSHFLLRKRRDGVLEKIRWRVEPMVESFGGSAASLPGYFKKRFMPSRSMMA